MILTKRVAPYIPQYSPGFLALPYPIKSSIQTQNLLSAGMRLMNHFTMSWTAPFGFVKLQTLKHVAQLLPLALLWARQASASQYHFSTPGLLDSERPS